jgi:Spy/CpxP family protein refolding chaperone
MKRLLIVPCLLLLATCATDDYNQPAPQQHSPYGGGQRGGMANAGGGGLEVMLPQDWWRDQSTQIAVNLTDDQIAQLEKIGRDQGEPIVQMQRDSTTAIAEIRTALNADPVKSEDIIAAGERVRNLRDTLFDRQVRMLAAERAILNHDQWMRLQDAIQQQRRQRQQQQNPYGGGHGGHGGRRPGFPGSF